MGFISKIATALFPKTVQTVQDWVDKGFIDQDNANSFVLSMRSDLADLHKGLALNSWANAYRILRDTSEFISEVPGKNLNPFYIPPNIRMTIIKNADHARQILGKPESEVSKGPVWEHEAAVFVPGLLNLSGIDYQALRKLAVDFFTPKQVIQTSQKTIEVIKSHVKSWPKYQTIDTLIYATDLQQDIALAAFVGGSFKFSNEQRQAVAAVLEALNLERLLSFHTYSQNPITNYVQKYKNAKETLLDAFLIEVIKRRAQPLPNDSSLLAILIQRSSDDKLIANTLSEAFLAGHETTALVINRLLYEWGRNQDAFNKVYEEVKLAFGEDIPIIDNLDALKRIRAQLPYTEAVIQEVLRLYPAAWATFRTTHKDIKLEDNTVIPKGTQLLISLYHSNRDGTVWPEPNKFIPERFLDNGSRNLIPFGYGSRICIGQHKALMDILLFSILFVQSFKIIQGHPTAVNSVGQFSLYPREPLTLILQPNNPKISLQDQTPQDAGSEVPYKDLQPPTVSIPSPIMPLNTGMPLK